MAKRRERLSEKKDNTFQLKMETDVLERYKTLLLRVEGRNGLASEADVNKRLLGLMPPDRLVTEKDILEFQNRQESKGTGRARVGKKEDQLAGGKKKAVNGNDD